MSQLKLRSLHIGRPEVSVNGKARAAALRIARWIVRYTEVTAIGSSVRQFRAAAVPRMGEDSSPRWLCAPIFSILRWSASSPAAGSLRPAPAQRRSALSVLPSADLRSRSGASRLKSSAPLRPTFPRRFHLLRTSGDETGSVSPASASRLNPELRSLHIGRPEVSVNGKARAAALRIARWFVRSREVSTIGKFRPAVPRGGCPAYGRRQPAALALCPDLFHPQLVSFVSSGRVAPPGSGPALHRPQRPALRSAAASTSAPLPSADLRSRSGASRLKSNAPLSRSPERLRGPRPELLSIAPLNFPLRLARSRNLFCCSCVAGRINSLRLRLRFAQGR